MTLRSVLESSWCGKTDLVLLIYFISVSIVKKDGDDIIKTCYTLDVMCSVIMSESGKVNDRTTL